MWSGYFPTQPCLVSSPLSLLTFHKPNEPWVPLLPEEPSGAVLSIIFLDLGDLLRSENSLWAHVDTLPLRKKGKEESQRLSAVVFHLCPEASPIMTSEVS